MEEQLFVSWVFTTNFFPVIPAESDHVNGNRLDNRRWNISLCSSQENNANNQHWHYQQNWFQDATVGTLLRWHDAASAGDEPVSQTASSLASLWPISLKHGRNKMMELFHSKSISSSAGGGMRWQKAGKMNPSLGVYDACYDTSFTWLRSCCIVLHQLEAAFVLHLYCYGVCWAWGVVIGPGNEIRYSYKFIAMNLYIWIHTWRI